MQRRLITDEAHTSLDIPQEIPRFRSAIYRCCGHFYFLSFSPFLFMILHQCNGLKQVLVIILQIRMFTICSYSYQFQNFSHEKETLWVIWSNSREAMNIYQNYTLQFENCQLLLKIINLNCAGLALYSLCRTQIQIVTEPGFLGGQLKRVK